jgi:hypothetical protein
MPSKTVSFVAREELAEWLEEKADRQMTTVSSTVQQILADKYREEQENVGVSEEAQQELDESGDGAPDDPLERWDEYWYHPNGDNYEYAVRRPEERPLYHKTAEGARNALERVYGES